MNILIKIWAGLIFMVLSPIVVPILFYRAVVKHYRRSKNTEIVWDKFKGYRKKGG